MATLVKKAHRALTDGEKAAMMIMRAKHMSFETIAKSVQRSVQTVKDFFDNMTKLAASSGIEYDFKDDLKMKAIDAVKAGLDDDKDNYKRGTIGVGVLKGLQVFAPDNAVQFNQLVANLPPEWEKRYLSNDDADAIPAEVVSNEVSQ